MNDNSPDAHAVLSSSLISGAIFGTFVPGDGLQKLLWIVLGGVAGLLAAWLPALVAGSIEQVVSPEKPACIKGTCKRDDDYEPQYTTERHPNYVYTYTSSYKCRCGDHYVAQDGEFMRLDATGELTPYMVKVNSRWIEARAGLDPTPSSSWRFSWFCMNLMGFAMPAAAMGAVLGTGVWHNFQIGTIVGAVIGVIIAFLGTLRDDRDSFSGSYP
ncbi:MAG: hypothetical protein K2W95_34380 [Candidatus Obscuribacterales bacterium]|nr:hypothetical protein [Candidatus Obscuribacterales bacterium]